MSKDKAYDAMLAREQAVDVALHGSEPRSPIEIEKTIIIASKAIIEAIWKARY